ncbi:MAG: C-GCAxxG-C-C family protein, partial [Acidobacteriota bacterium]
GFRCSQAVFEAYAADYGLEGDLARRIATPLAGGSGIGGECGAVTGAFLVIGLLHGVDDANDIEGYRRVFQKVKTLAERFRAVHGEIDCHRLLGVDVLTEEGFKEYLERNLHETHCARYVRDAVNLLEEVL